MARRRFRGGDVGIGARDPRRERGTGADVTMVGRAGRRDRAMLFRDDALVLCI